MVILLPDSCDHAKKRPYGRSSMIENIRLIDVRDWSILLRLNKQCLFNILTVLRIRARLLTLCLLLCLASVRCCPTNPHFFASSLQPTTKLERQNKSRYFSHKFPSHWSGKIWFWRALVRMSTSVLILPTRHLPVQLLQNQIFFWRLKEGFWSFSEIQQFHSTELTISVHHCNNVFLLFTQMFFITKIWWSPNLNSIMLSHDNLPRRLLWSAGEQVAALFTCKKIKIPGLSSSSLAVFLVFIFFWILWNPCSRANPILWPCSCFWIAAF